MDNVACFLYENYIGTSNTRGPTRYLSAAKKRKGQARLSVEIDECAGRLVGIDSQKLITKGGCVARQCAKFDGTGWKHQDEDLKNKMIEKCTVRCWF